MLVSLSWHIQAVSFVASLRVKLAKYTVTKRLKGPIWVLRCVVRVLPFRVEVRLSLLKVNDNL